MEHKTVLVTGAAGFIGSHIVEHLLQANYRVVGIDNFSENYPVTVKERNLTIALSEPSFNFHRLDILDRASLEAVFLKVRPNVVVHLAAKAGVRESFREAESYIRINVQGTVNVLEAAGLASVDHFVFASSSAVYGRGNQPPFHEDYPLTNSVSVYGASKAAGEILCHAYHQTYGYDVTCVRLFTVYGPRQRPDLAFSTFARQLMGDQPIILHGNGSVMRDYTYISDAINGVMAAIAAPDGFSVYNLGSGRPVSLMHSLAILEQVVGKKAKISFEKLQLSEMNVTHADISRAAECLSYKPSTSLEQGIEHFVKWFKQTHTTD